MAYAIIGGLFVATVLTLLFLLALLYRLHLHQGVCKGATGGNQRTGAWVRRFDLPPGRRATLPARYGDLVRARWVTATFAN